MPLQNPADNDQRDPIERASEAHRAGDFAAAESLYRQVLASKPKHAQARMLLGALLANTDREQEASEVLRDLVSDQPSNFSALSWLAGVLCTLGENEEAVAMAKRALAVRPNDVNTLLHLATGEFALSHFEEAARAFLMVIKLGPRALSAYYGLASTFLKLGEPLKARLVMRDALAISADPQTLHKLAEVCLTCDLTDDVVEATDRILRSDPMNLEALILKSRAHSIAGNEAGEVATIDVILRLAPDDYRAHLHRGRRLQDTGRFDEAEPAFRRSIELKPRQGVAYYAIVAGRKVKPEDAGLIETMEALAKDGGLSDDDQTHLEYGLGKAYDNLGDYAKAMAHFDEGNRLMGEMRPWTRRFDREGMRRLFEQLTVIFSREELRRVRETPQRPIRPVIVSGIMRSGTTLMEQILSKHPQIGAAGEQQFWPKTLLECVDFEKESYNTDCLESAANGYCALLARLAPGYEVVTEKNPANRTAYGLIHIAFPEARILHMQRNPIDVAISIWTTMMRTGAPFMGDKEAIVFALKMHRELTEHWLEALPEDRFRIVSYERLTADTENVTREAVDFLGLPWSGACLSPETNERTVATPSLWQVRQPVYTTSVERWRRYEPYLGSFADLLD